MEVKSDFEKDACYLYIILYKMLKTNIQKVNGKRQLQISDKWVVDNIEKFHVQQNGFLPNSSLQTKKSLLSGTQYNLN